MRFKLENSEAVFKYGTLATSDDKLTCLDIKQTYVDLGGKISADTEIEFDKYFPSEPYARTALTDRMPKTYLCMGSGSARMYNPGIQPDVVSISVYRDTSGHSRTGDHYNLFLQYEIGGQKDHTDKIQNRHILLKDGVVIKSFVDNIEIAENTVTVK